VADTILLLQGDRAGGTVRDLLNLSGADVVTAAAGASALALHDRVRPDMVVLDDTSGDRPTLDLLASLAARGAMVLVIAAAGTPAAARALALGGQQVLVTPVEADEFRAAVDRMRAVVHLRREHNRSRARRLDRGGLEAFGSSPTMRALAVRLEEAASAAGAPLLLVGEVGTGKGWIARLVHEMDVSRKGLFLDVGAPDHVPVPEVELFGREADMNGGEPRHAGLLEVADHGSVFFREIGDLGVGLQAKLAAVLGSGTMRRVRGSRDLALDVRVIAATTRDLSPAVRDGAFHAALFDRLGHHTIRLPAVRERTREERLALVDQLIALLHQRLPDVPGECAPEAAERLIAAPWPGNVRELRAVLERALLLSRGASRLGVEHLPPDLGDGPALHDERPGERARPVPLVAVEREFIERALRYHHGNRTRAAHDLGISRATLINKIKTFALDL
jgi:two-component system response regulator AtoC